MKKGFLSVLLTLFMMLAVMPVTAYAVPNMRYCDYCNGEPREAYISGYQLRNQNFHYEIYSCTTCHHVVGNDLKPHSFSGTATCTTGRICRCGYEYGALGHNYISTVTQAPTCTQDGVRTYVCKNDSSHTYTEPIPATEHNYESSVTTEATCTTEGVRTYVCKNDSSHTYTEPIPAAGHNYESSVTTKPTCTTDGVRTYVCKNDSSHTYTEPISAVAHDWSSNWISDENNHWHKCNACEETTDVGEHIWNSGVITTSPTCTTAGEKTYTCSECERKKTEVISATGHNFVHHEAQEATCTAIGWKAYDTCNNCNYSSYQEIPVKDHSYGEATYKWSADNQNCTAERKCTVCDNVENETAATTAQVVQARNCTLPELTTYSVTFENSAFESQTKKNVQTADATGHNLKKVEKKDATATEEGNSTYWFCDKCNKYFSDAKAETEIKKEDTVLAKLSTVNKKETEASSAKTANATKVTSTTDKTTKSSPKTGDSTDVQLYVILMIVSIGAAAGAGAKRKLKTHR